LAGRDSFQKRQKEAARREKRQLKLERRKGRQPSHSDTSSGTIPSDQLASPSEFLPIDMPERSSADPLFGLPLPAGPEPPVERRMGVFKPASAEPEPPKNDSPPHER
jgi:hypothetical protein